MILITVYPDRTQSNCKFSRWSHVDSGTHFVWGGFSGLGFVAIAFDLLFMTQHYILYRDRTDFYLSSVDEERRRLIAEGRVPREEDVVY